MSSRSIHYRTCNLCEAMCGLAIEHEGGEVLGVRGDEADRFSRGHICPKGAAIARLHEDPDRLRKPMRRTSSGWRELDWDDALDAAAEGLHRVQREHGKDALAVYLGNPAVHNHAVGIFAPPFLRMLRTRHRYSATSVDQLPQMLVAHLMFGHQLLLPIPDLDRAEYLMIVGANPLVSNGSIMSAPDVRKRLRDIQARGGKLVVLDPRRTETAKLADAHEFVRPGTDALLLLAMLALILDEGRERPGPLAALLRGAQRLRTALAPFTPERAALATGVPAARIVELARELASRRGAVYGRVGASTQRFGALAHWAINLLNIFTGALDRPGGVMFTQPAIDPIGMPRGLGVGPGSFGRWRSRVRALPEFGGELPVASFSEDVFAGHAQRSGANERPLAPIRGLLSIAGNPVLSTPNGSELGRALEALDFVVSVDIYLNETTRHADLILPPTSVLERSHYDLVFHLLAVRNTAKWSPPLFEPPAGALHDWQIIDGLWSRLERLRGDPTWSARGAHELLTRLGPEGVLDLGLRAGPHGRKLPAALASLPVLGRQARGLDLATLRANPHGVDLGPLEPCLPDRLPAAQIELVPPALLDDLGRLERSIPALESSAREPEPESPRSSFALIGRRLLRSNNSWMHNLPKLVAGKDPCTLMMHPSDATGLALRPGDRVRVRSAVGELEVPLELTEDLMPGVVSLPHGFGHGRPDTRAEVANAHPGASINDLTDPAEIDELSGVAALCGVSVRVSLAQPLEAAE